MPQLNPNPWLFIMISSWLIYSLIIQPKILSFPPTNPPSEAPTAPSKTSPWPWPWT
uniref:ATP synthase complex subunit 8 n=1 Tax=Phaethornis malaris TaxID=304671 RepID=A0A172CAF1_9AVES|nr:ATP synthase F0 subunit 8 [Phaethornis malaris]AKT26298.1 ATP synthase F0 subunit 8 [Phaethornis malaris]